MSMTQFSKYVLVLLILVSSGIVYVRFIEKKASGIEDLKISTWKDNATFAATLSFDDGYQATYSTAIPILRSHNTVGSFNVIAGRIGSSYAQIELATWDDWRVVAREGHEIVSHTTYHKHLPELSEKEIMSELRESRALIESNIEGQRALSFVYPGGDYDPWSKKVVEDFYLSARSSDSGFNPSTPPDFFSLKSMVVYPTTTTEDLNAWAGSAYDNGEWLIEMYHLVNTSNPTGYEYFNPPEILDSHLDYLNKKNVWVDTQQNVVKYIQERDNTQIFVVSENRFRLVLSLINELDKTVFNSPLTISARIPSDWGSINVVQGVHSVKVIPDNNGLIYFKATPGAGDIVVSRVLF